MKITNLLKLMIPVLVIGALSSCCHDIDCTTGRLSVIGFINFADTNQINSAILRSYQQDSPYAPQNIIASFKLSQYSSESNVSGDTVRYTIADDAPFHLTPGFKYQLFVPATSDSLTIDSIADQQTQLQACSGTEFTAKACDNPLVAIYVNGAPISSNTSYQIIYITK